MRRAVIIGNNPFRTDYYRRDYKQVFEEVGSNTGNQAINLGLACHMADSAVFLPGGASPAAIRSAGDILVFPMANHLGSHTDLGRMADRIDEINLPVLGLGLGAQASSNNVDIKLTPGTVRWLETIVRRAPSEAPNLGVRGLYTQAQLAKLGMPMVSLVTGCPSNFINPDPDLTKKLELSYSTNSYNQIAVCAGIPFVPDLQEIERELADIVTLTNGAYIVQHGINMVQIARNDFANMEPKVLENCRSYIMPNASTDEFILWCRRFAYAFFDGPAWMDFLRRFDFVVGTRFHGAMFALQAGVAAGCIAHDSRTLEMCETMAIPVVHYKDIRGPLTRRNIRSYFNFDAERYTAIRQELHKNFSAIYAGADLEVNPAFSKVFG